MAAVIRAPVTANQDPRKMIGEASVCTVGVFLIFEGSRSKRYLFGADAFALL